MADSVLLATPQRHMRGRVWVFRALCALAVLLLVRVAASLGGAAHAGWLAASLGGVLAVTTAWRVRQAPREFLATDSLHPAAVSPRLLTGLAAMLAALTLLPLLTTALPPFDDYANDLARIHIIAAAGADPALAQFYAVVWQVVSDLGINLLLLPLAAAIGLYAAGKMLLVGATLLLLVGPFVLQAALFRRLSAAPLLAALFVHGYAEKLGVLDYQIGLGLALLAIAAWIALRERGPVLRAMVSAGCVVVLLMCHLAALGLYALALFSFEAWRWDGLRRWPIDVAVLLLPFLPAAALLLLGPQPDTTLLPWQWGGLHGRLDALRMLIQGYDAPRDAVFLLALAAGLLAALRANMLRLHPAGWLFLLIGGAVFLVVPERAMGAWGGTARLPYGMVFVLCGMTRCTLPTLRARTVFAAALLALMLFRTVTTEEGFLRYDRVRRDLVASLPLIAPGSRILVAADYRHADDALRAIWDLPCLAIIERSSLVSMENAQPGSLVSVRPPYRASVGGYDDDPVSLPDLLHPPSAEAPADTLAYDPSGRIYWRHWAQDYDYVYIMDRVDTTNPASDRLEKLFSGDRLQLFRIRHF